MHYLRQLGVGLGFLVTILLLDKYVFIEQALLPDSMVWVETKLDPAVSAATSKPAVNGFWIDRYEVSNADFAEFIAATNYKTHAEQVASSLVFKLPDPGHDVHASPAHGWRQIKHADWQHPQGPQDSITGKAEFPVVQVNYNDARDYCEWRGKQLPTLSQFEIVAAAADLDDAANQPLLPAQHTETMAASWRGETVIPAKASADYRNPVAVGSSQPNRYGLYDIDGNAWEWVSAPTTSNPQSGTNLVGFRCVLNQRDPQALSQSRELKP